MEIYLVVLFAGALLAGLLGSLTGLGGGIVIVPLLTLGLGVDIKYAVGTSLVAVIATSSGAAVSYVKEGLTNFRIGMFLETATTVGAICGAALASIISSWFLMIIFGILLLYSAFNSFKTRKTEYINQEIKNSSFAKKLKLEGIYHVSSGNNILYRASHVLGGYLMMIVAGILSGLLGIGSGAFKVIAMDSIMKLPFKVSSATSNFMIGVTAAASAGVYISRGYIDPVLSMPVVLGVLIGSMTGARVLMRSNIKILKIVFSIVILILGIQMIRNGVLDIIK